VVFELRALAQALGQRDAVHARMFWSVSTRLKSLLAGLLPGVLPVHGLDDVEAGVLQVNETICRIEAESSTARIECIAFSGNLVMSGSRTARSSRRPSRPGSRGLGRGGASSTTVFAVLVVAHHVARPAGRRNCAAAGGLWTISCEAMSWNCSAVTAPPGAPSRRESSSPACSGCCAAARRRGLSLAVAP